MPEFDEDLTRFSFDDLLREVENIATALCEEGGNPNADKLNKIAKELIARNANQQRQANVSSVHPAQIQRAKLPTKEVPSRVRGLTEPPPRGRR